MSEEYNTLTPSSRRGGHALRVCARFILRLLHAETVQPLQWLHVTSGSRCEGRDGSGKKAAECEIVNHMCGGTSRTKRTGWRMSFQVGCVSSSAPPSQRESECQ